MSVYGHVGDPCTVDILWSGLGKIVLGPEREYILKTMKAKGVIFVLSNDMPCGHNPSASADVTGFSSVSCQYGF